MKFSLSSLSPIAGIVGLVALVNIHPSTAPSSAETYEIPRVQGWVRRVVRETLDTPRPTNEEIIKRADEAFTKFDEASKKAREWNRRRLPSE